MIDAAEHVEEMTVLATVPFMVGLTY